MERNTLNYYRRVLAGAWRLLWPVLRQVLGWIFIVLGLLGLVLPLLQGVLFLVIGVALVGQRNWLIRRSMIVVKRFLRRWAAVQVPLIGAAGRLALKMQRKGSRESRHLHRRIEEWSHKRKLRRAGPPSDDSQDTRYDPTSERV